jgi:hypothetical protein
MSWSVSIHTAMSGSPSGAAFDMDAAKPVVASQEAQNGREFGLNDFDTKILLLERFAAIDLRKFLGHKVPIAKMDDSMSRLRRTRALDAGDEGSCFSMGTTSAASP